MRIGFTFVACVALASFLGSAPAAAAEAMFCIRGQSFEKDREFLQTRRLRLRVEGPLPDGLVLPTATHAVREKLWPNLKPEEVQVAVFDVELCGEEPLAELSIGITQGDLDAIVPELSRGPGDRPRLTAVARAAQAKAAPPKTPPSGTSNDARRHDWVRLYFVTTRQPTGDSQAASAFGKTRSEGLTFGTVDVSIPADHRWAKLESPSVLKLEWDANPNRHVTLADSFRVHTVDAVKSQLAKKAGGFSKAGVLLFVHGYNNTFAEASQRAAQLAYDLAFPGPTVMFSWPSDGDLLSYMRDEEHARSAWRQMAQVLDLLTQLGPNVPVFVVAHSMGSRVLTQGLAELLRQRPGADRVIRQVVLASPDVGEEEFRQRWIFDLKSANPPRYTLYASNHDLPVALSAWLHGEPRLGSGGQGIAVFSGLDSIDASSITEEWFGMSHSYFGDNATVMSDLFLVIHEGRDPDKRPRLRRVRGSRGEYWTFKR